MADPRESRADDPTCSRGGSPAILVRVAGLKSGAGKVRVQAYGPGAAKYFKKGQWAGRVDVPLSGRRSVDICLPLPAAGHYSIAVRHDANANKKSDWNDGAGFSRNPKLNLLSRPSFAQTAVAVQRGPARINVVINYRQGMTVGPIG
ncbi:MAG: DUF2141 domain-containing protein [Sphingomonas bacterium]|nr:DUF2141 domain-containing protein [Sphingomonas bacterium]